MKPFAFSWSFHHFDIFFYFEMQQLTGLMLIDSKWADLQRVQYASSTLTLRTNKLERLLQFFTTRSNIYEWISSRPTPKCLTKVSNNLRSKRSSFFVQSVVVRERKKFCNIDMGTSIREKVFESEKLLQILVHFLIQLLTTIFLNFVKMSKHNRNQSCHLVAKIHCNLSIFVCYFITLAWNINKFILSYCHL